LFRSLYLESPSNAVTARICATNEDAFFPIDHDRAGVAHRLIPIGAHVDIVAARTQTGDARLSDASFEMHARRLIRGVFTPAPAGRLDGRLRIHIIARDARRKLQSGLRLPFST